MSAGALKNARLPKLQVQKHTHAGVAPSAPARYNRLIHFQGRSSVVEQRPFKPKVVGSIPTAPTSFLIHFTGLATTARQQKAALTAGQRRRASKTSRHRWQTDPIIRCNAGGFPCCSALSVPKLFRNLSRFLTEGAHSAWSRA